MSIFFWRCATARQECVWHWKTKGKHYELAIKSFVVLSSFFFSFGQMKPRFSNRKPRQPPATLVPPWLVPVPLSVPGVKRSVNCQTAWPGRSHLTRIDVTYAGYTTIFTDGSCAETSFSSAFVVPSEETARGFNPRTWL